MGWHTQIRGIRVGGEILCQSWQCDWCIEYWVVACGRGACPKLLLDGCKFNHIPEILTLIDDFEQVQGDVLVLYVYQLKTDQNGIENVGVEKVSFRRNSELAT